MSRKNVGGCKNYENIQTDPKLEKVKIVVFGEASMCTWVEHSYNQQNAYRIREAQPSGWSKACLGYGLVWTFLIEVEIAFRKSFDIASMGIWVENLCSDYLPNLGGLICHEKYIPNPVTPLAPTGNSQ